MREGPDDIYIYSPESDDGWPSWKRAFVNWSVVLAALAVIGLIVLLGRWAGWLVVALALPIGEAVAITFIFVCIYVWAFKKWRDGR